MANDSVGGGGCHNTGGGNFHLAPCIVRSSSGDPPPCIETVESLLSAGSELLSIHRAPQEKHCIPAVINSVRYITTGMGAFHLRFCCIRHSGCGGGGGGGGGEIRGFLSMPGGAQLSELL